MTMSDDQSIDVRTAAFLDEDEISGDIGDIRVAEYVTFLLALDTFMRWIEEASGGDADPERDPLVRKGLGLLRIIEQQSQDAIRAFMDANLPTSTHKRMLNRAFTLRPSADGAARRALTFRTVLSLGGTQTMRSVFDVARARRTIQVAIAASTMEDADAALDKFAAVPVTNARIRTWIDQAAATAGPGTYQNPVAAATAGASDDVQALTSDRMRQSGRSTTSEAVIDGAVAQDTTLVQVQEQATVAARRAMDRSGEADEPPTRSEVIGLATAAAASVLADPDDRRNVPTSLQSLANDPEQLAAALTDGRVLVAAGAGSGKSRTLVARVTYLVRERNVVPGRILVTSFNTKAASDLKYKIGKEIGGPALKQMSVGTMHSIFRRIIGEYGTPEEKIAVGVGGGNAPNGLTRGGTIAAAVNRAWSQCYPTEEVPSVKKMMMYKTKWAGNNITPAQAKASARKPEEVQAARWYEWYEGFKGSIPGWRPTCRNTPKEWETFMSRRRMATKDNPNGIRLGDFDDMLSIALAVIKRNPGVRRTLQGQFDHVLVDEAQDMNAVQFETLSLLTEQITDGQDGRSFWCVGDASQCIYSFRGARPDMFVDLSRTPGVVTRLIQTNYRCAPEIVDAANLLISHNDPGIPMEARPQPGKPRGTTSLRVSTPIDEAAGAIQVAREIRASTEAGGSDVTDYAVLCRTNAELNAFETAIMLKGLPYARRGASSFFGSPETTAVLSYVQLATGDDFEKMQGALKKVINRPNRFFLRGGPEVGEEIVDKALVNYALRIGRSKKDINPIVALEDPAFLNILAAGLSGSGPGDRKYRGAYEKLQELQSEITGMRARVQDEGVPYSTTDLFNDILNLRGVTGRTNPTTGRTEWVELSFRESLQIEMKSASGPDDDEEEEHEDSAGLGNITFLFELAKQDPEDPGDMGHDPGTPLGFRAKMERIASRARELRIDIDKWNKEQEAKPPEERRPPPGVYLGTVHSTKGAQWANCFVQMPGGKFPMERRPRPGEPPPDPEEEELEFQSERRLGYVALTRAMQDLTILCPSVVGGRAAGVSVFVSEAGLHQGENVTHPEGTVEPVPADVDRPEPGTNVREADQHDYDRN